MGAGGIALGQELAVGAADDTLGYRPLHSGLGVAADLTCVGEAAETALLAGVDTLAVAVSSLSARSRSELSVSLKLLLKL